MTEDEYRTKAMLLGMEAMFVAEFPYVLFREKVGPSRFAGCALYNYYNGDTLSLVIANRSGLDRAV